VTTTGEPLAYICLAICCIYPSVYAHIYRLISNDYCAQYDSPVTPPPPPPPPPPMCMPYTIRGLILTLRRRYSAIALSRNISTASCCRTGTHQTVTRKPTGVNPNAIHACSGLEVRVWVMLRGQPAAKSARPTVLFWTWRVSAGWKHIYNRTQSICEHNL